MSYNTSFRLEYKEQSPSLEEIARTLSLTEPTPLDQTPDPRFNEPRTLDLLAHYWSDVLQGEEETTWYRHQANMVTISSLWPDVTFTLYLRGEDPDDRWAEYYRNGKLQTSQAQITYDQFDPGWLTDLETSPNDLQSPEVFLHRGVLLRTHGAQYLAVPISATARPLLTRPDGKVGLILNAPTKDQVIAQINGLLDSNPSFPLTDINLREEAKAQVIEALHNAQADLQPGLIYHEMADIPEASQHLASHIQQWIDHIENHSIPTA